MICVFFPLTMVTGMSGVLFKQLGWMMCVIMTVSTTSALSFTPMLCSQMLKLQKKQSKAFKMFYTPISKALAKLDDWYTARINWAVRHRATVIIGSFLLFIFSLVLAKVVGIESEYFPANDNGRIGATLELPIGSRVEQAEELAQRMTNMWKERYGSNLRVINYRVGRAGDSNTFASMNSNGDYLISFNITLVPSNQRKIGLAKVCDEMREDCKNVPELAKYRIMMGGQQGGMGGQNTATFEVYGYDMQATYDYASALRDSFRNSPIVTEALVSRSDYEPELVVNFDRDKLAMYGLGMSDAAGHIRNLINGSLLSYFREDGEEYDIKVRFEPTARQSVNDLENLLIPNNQGVNIRVGDIATIEESSIPPTIERKDRQRIVTVTAVLKDGYALSEGVDLGNQLTEKIDRPSGVTVQVAGSYEDQQEANRDLGTLGALIIILVFIVMAAQFESLTYPFIIIISIVFALSGIIFALLLTGTSINIMSMLGGIMLIGIVVKNGIVLIDYTQLMRERGMGLIRSAVVAARSRLRPILMTSLTTILGMLPLAAGQGVGSEMWRPLGVSIIGGLTVSTIMTLVYVPSMFCIFGANGVKVKRRKMRKQRELQAYWNEHKQEEMLNAQAFSEKKKK